MSILERPRERQALKPQSKRQSARAELKRQLELDKSANPEGYDRGYKYLMLLGVPALLSLELLSSFNGDLDYLFVSGVTTLTASALLGEKLVFLRRLRLGRASRTTEQTDLGELRAEPIPEDEFA